MLYREIIAVCSQIHKKHINTLCGQNVEFGNVKLVVHIVTTGLLTLRRLMSYIYIYIYMEHPFLMFLDHTQRRSTVGRTPLDE